MSSSRSILVRMLETASSSDEARMSNECLRKPKPNLCDVRTCIPRTLFTAPFYEWFAPEYFREGASIPEEIARERVIFIKRAPIDPPEREQEELPEMAAEPEEERKPLRNFDQPIRYPNLGIL
jgi:hypothetical protein